MRKEKTLTKCGYAHLSCLYLCNSSVLGHLWPGQGHSDYIQIALSYCWRTLDLYVVQEEDLSILLRAKKGTVISSACFYESFNQCIFYSLYSPKKTLEFNVNQERQENYYETYYETQLLRVGSNCNLTESSTPNSTSEYSGNHKWACFLGAK